jgi:hypothetical protein
MFDPASSMAQSEESRSEAIAAFLCGGLSPTPSKAQLVSALANARRAFAHLLASGGDVNARLRGEMRFDGVRENAATLAAIEVAENRNAVTRVRSVAHGSRPHRQRAVETLCRTIF